MPRCELTGKGPVVKNLVSHSNIKTKTVDQPNVQKRRLFSRALNQLVCLRVATSTIRDIEHTGGLDKFLLRQCDGKLSTRALTVKKRIRAKLTPKKNKTKPVVKGE
jgi:large subunit ribosomal protein L28